MGAARSAARSGALLIGLAGLLFLVYPVVRPYSDETTLAGARALSSPAWIVSHLAAVIGFILIPLGLLALRDLLGASPVRGLASWAMFTAWVGVGLTLPYYGAEIFGGHAIAQRALDDNNADLLKSVEVFRYHPVAVTTFLVGLLLLAIGAVLAAIAVARSGLLPRWSGTLFAAGFVLFIPQFFTPAPVRMVHGLLIAIGCGWLALGMWRGGQEPKP
ncbi:MAG: hypothetical protein ACRDTF_04360 [Pseudonocardiaceae bacterium]